MILLYYPKYGSRVVDLDRVKNQKNFEIIFFYINTIEMLRKFFSIFLANLNQKWRSQIFLDFFNTLQNHINNHYNY